MITPWRLNGDGVDLTVRLTPKGGRDRIDGIGQDAAGKPVLLVRVVPPPVDGAANKALVKFLAKQTGVAKSRISFISGETARVKRLNITGDGKSIAAALLEQCRRD